MAKALGIGGVFFKCRDAAKLAGWYAKWLDFPVDPRFPGAAFLPTSVPPGGCTVWGAFSADTDYFSPSPKEFMINVMVDDLDGALARVREGGARILEEIQSLDNGRFGWFIDPEGNKVELWEPKPEG